VSTLPDVIPQAWHDRRFVYFRGQFHTNAETGEDYPTLPLSSLWEMEPGDKAKGAGLAMIPSMYFDYDAREHQAQRERGRYIALTGDIDGGNHDADAVAAAVEAFAPAAAWLVYSSAHSRPGDQRWRIIIPLADPATFDAWHDAQSAFFAFMEHRGIEMDHALARSAQPVYLPNVPPSHKSGTALRGPDGKPLYYETRASSTSLPGLALGDGMVAQGIAAICQQRAIDQAERERIRKEAEKRRAAKPRGDSASLIEDFNASNSVETLLAMCGYEQSPRSAEDWHSPQQSGDTFATRIIGSKWVSLSASDAASGLGEKCASGCYGDAYDLYVHYKHGGDHKSAFRQLHAEKRGDNVVYPAAFNEPPPDWMSEAPPYQEPPEWMDCGEDEPLVDEVADPTSPSLPFFWFNDAEPSLDASDFVEGLLTTGSMSVVYGPSNCGKTFFVVDMALHVAWGRDWRGRAVDRGAIVYLSLEGAQGIRNRLAAFRRHHNLAGTELPFVAMPKPVNLLDSDADVLAVIELVNHVAATTELPVSMVIIDTLSRAMAGGNENSPEDMTALIGNCDSIRHATGSHVCIVHHSGKDEARGARGHSSLRAATDTEIEIKRDPEMTFSSVRVVKQRDLEAGEPFGFTLQSVALGTNRRGKDVTSCVVVEADKAVVIGRTAERLSDKEQAALQSLEHCLEAGGFDIEMGRDMPVVTGVTLHAWKRALQARDVIDRDKDDTARKQLQRIRQGLVAKGKIQIDGVNVWRA
jgi:hypothetical protein